MIISSSRLFQLFKYSVYALLAFDIYVFWAEEALAAEVQFANGVAISDLINAYAATIDTAAWVVLLLIFELETDALDDHHLTPLVARSLQAVRAICYVFIVYAFYGYLANLSFVYQTTLLPGVSDLCSLVPHHWSVAIDLDEYAKLSDRNCGSFSDATAFHRFTGLPVAVDNSGLTNIRYLAWTDVINAAVWLLVVAILEIDVWLQERNRFDGPTLRISNAVKFILYAALLAAAIYWGFNGDFIDFWDAFLFLVAFVLIEMNVFKWRQEGREAAELRG